MKKSVLIFFSLLAMTLTAQKKQKIKGNREVLIKKFDLPYFNAIEVGEKFEINLKKATDTTRVVIETDDNLFDVIHFKVENKVLSFRTSMEIVKKKRLRITVFVPEEFNKIHLKEKAKIYNDELLQLQSLKIEANNRSRVKMNINLKDFLNLNAFGKATINMTVFVPKASINLLEDTEFEGKVNIRTATVNIEDHAYCKLEGNIEEFDLKVKEKAKVKADKLLAKAAKLVASDKAVTHINVTKQLKMSLSGNTETYIYGTPEIKLKSFEDHAALYKQ